MTRLVDVRAVCDGCSAAAAAVFCVSHRNVLCPPCDLSQHSARAAASHQRVDLSTAVTALAFCEHCDDAPATTYCESESLTLCHKCDTIVHEAVEIPHWRTPIERTLRCRAVEFRVASRPRQTGRPRPSQVPHAYPAHQRPLSPEKRENGRDAPKFKPQSLDPDPLPPTVSPTRQRPMPASAISSHPLATHVPPAIAKPRTMHSQQLQAPQRTQSVAPISASAPPLAPQYIPTPQRRRPRPSVKRKREMQRLSQYTQNFRPLDVPFSRAHILPTDDFFSYQAGVRTSQPIPDDLHTGLHSQQTSQPQLLQEPLLMDTDSRYLDLGMLGGYEGLDLSGEATAIEGVSASGKSASASGSAAGSDASPRHQTPDFDMLPAGPRVPRNAPTQASLREMVASAVAAAGEQFLLNTVSSGSGSSLERESPPVDMSCAPDPAGLVAAATAAAASAAAQAGASVDLSSEVLKGVPAALATEAMTEVLPGRMRQPRIARRVSEPAIPSARDMAKVEAAREAISDEAMRRLEIESRRVKQEDIMRVGTLECERDQLVSQMCDGDDVLRRGDEMGYLEISRDDFGGVFDSIDLSQFEQNASGGLGFGTGEFRPVLDSDEG